MNGNNGNHAHTRHGDPETSHAAAESVERLTEKQTAVLRVLHDHGPLCDQDIAALYSAPPAQSESGLRTRRSELVDQGLVRDTGERVKLESGRMSILWEVAGAAVLPPQAESLFVVADPAAVMATLQDLTSSLDKASKALYKVERECDEAAEAYEAAVIEWDEAFNDRLIAFTEPYLDQDGRLARLPGEDVRAAYITKGIRTEHPELYGRHRRTKHDLDRMKAELKRGKDRAARIESQISALQSVLSMLKTEAQAT